MAACAACLASISLQEAERKPETSEYNTEPRPGLTSGPGTLFADYDADTGRFTALAPMGEKGGDKDWYGYCVDDPVNRVDTWGLEESWWDGAGGRITRSGLKGMGTGAISGAGAGALGGGIGAVPGSIVGASVGLPVGLLRGVGEEIYQQYVGGNVQDTATELSDTMSEQSTVLRNLFFRE